ncbi:MAG: sulfatase-like hydrolase/transferase, partial [Muribaculaceae bacterium]|nr:sulfatase-like hydrolase/transferase [Muribaculaceae bacterium]
MKELYHRLKQSPQAQLLVAFWVALWLVMTLFALELMLYSYVGATPSRVLTALLFALAESVVLMLPFVWWRSWRYVMLPALWLLTAFFLLNQAFVRFGGEMPALTVFTMTDNVNNALIDSIRRLVRWVDAGYIAVVIVFTVYWVKSWRKMRGCKQWLSKPVKRKATLLILVVLVVWQTAAGVWAWYRYHSFDYAPRSASGWLTFKFRRVGVPMDVERPHYYLDFGLTAYTAASVVELLDYLTVSHQLTDDQLALVESHIARYADSDFTQLFADNRGKNLILIIVESLNSEFIDSEIGGVEVTPTLNRLIREPGTVSALNVVTQVRDGISSDGQMLLNTGLLPLTKGSTMMRYGAENSYESLATKLSGHYPAVYFANEPNFWNKGVSFANLGFGTIKSAEDFVVDPVEVGADRAMFDLIVRDLPKMKQPFFIEAVTMSMHYGLWPEDDVMSGDFAHEGYQPEHLKFVRSTQYFDSQLAWFLVQLKQMGLYDNTVVILASDHSLAATRPGTRMTYYP